ncbi:PRD domain-containing protein [Enterococcus gilvus]|uniref:PRD domain-containing protein n=1 Tax=Enterococcus gilvus TaxID=160453 RepID=UPI0028D4F03E|nr:PRD domain-containing protein [Enterococcus gilvus]
MRIKQSYNNNIILVSLDDVKEAVIIGTGIGFSKKPGDRVDETKIKSIYYSENVSEKTFNDSILSVAEPAIISFVESALETVERNLGITVYSSLFISLVEHFNNLMMNGSYLDDEHPLRWIVKRVYPEIYDVSKQIYCAFITTIDVPVPRSEIVSISLHIINGVQKNSMPDTMEITRTINEILRVLEYSQEFRLDPYDVDYSRFVTHLEFLFNRLRSNNKYIGRNYDLVDEKIDEKVFTNFENDDKVMLILEKILKIIQKKYGEVSKAEKLFLLIHLLKLSSY